MTNKRGQNRNFSLCNFFPKNRRGQEVSPVAVIVGVILAVAVLVLLILGFTLGWDKILPWIPKDNIQSLTTQCSVACSLNNKYDYCTVERTFKAPTLPAADNGQKKGTCSSFETLTDKDSKSYGFEKCTTISCTTG